MLDTVTMDTSTIADNNCSYTIQVGVMWHNKKVYLNKILWIVVQGS